MSLSFKKTPSDCEAQCPDCGVTLSRLADMNRHRKTKHPDGTETKFHCLWSGCGYESTQKGNLKSHVDARHSDGPKYPCPECGRRFTDAAARIRHRKKIHGYVPYHTKEYLARQALNRKERVDQAASKAVSNEDRHQQVACAVPGDLPNDSSSASPPTPKLPEVTYHNNFWKRPVDSYLPQPPQDKARLQQVACAVPGDLTNASSSVPPPAPKLPEVAYHDNSWKMPFDITRSYLLQPPPNKARLQQVACTIPGGFTDASSSTPPSAPKLPKVAYHDNFWKMPVDSTHSYLPQPLQNKARLQQVACAIPGFPPNTSLSAPPPAPKLPEVAYRDNFWKMPVDSTHSYLPQSPQNKARLQQVACVVPSLLPNTSSSALSPAPKLPEVAYHDSFWKMPVDSTHSYLPQPPQPPPSQDFPLSLPFETCPGYGTHNAIQHFPSAAQSPPPVTLSDSTAEYYPDLHVPQPDTMPFEKQEYVESFTGDCGMPPYNWDGQ